MIAFVPFPGIEIIVQRLDIIEYSTLRRILIRHGVLHMQALAHAALACLSPIATSSLALRSGLILLCPHRHVNVGFPGFTQSGTSIPSSSTRGGNLLLMKGPDCQHSEAKISRAAIAGFLIF
jgi:hypothetical protein